MCLAFDTDLREAGFTLEGTTAIVKRDSHYTKAGIWGGLTEDILENEEWFQSWLEGERRCKRIFCLTNQRVYGMLFVVANSQYIDIISDSNAWQIADSDHTVVDEAHNELRPTTSAYRLTALVEQITGMYLSSAHVDNLTIHSRTLSSYTEVFLSNTISYSRAVTHS